MDWSLLVAAEPQRPDHPQARGRAGRRLAGEGVQQLSFGARALVDGEPAREGPRGLPQLTDEQGRYVPVAAPDVGGRVGDLPCQVDRGDELEGVVVAGQ
ncbi:hypothetical protein AB0N81_27090 [Streptomyces sp. NPDC093510]|uniref:hypothetical protein n=1 Tax=Streptomyces sp. NPDC093510 TaxID=3155199 RepID=UPI003427B3B2